MNRILFAQKAFLFFSFFRVGRQGVRRYVSVPLSDEKIFPLLLGDTKIAKPLLSKVGVFKKLDSVKKRLKEGA
jgi:hypothetical protein